jgi:uncharacterized membrane protein YvlD (DUF360 family)
MKTLRTLTVAIIRLGVVWVIDTLALLVTAAIIRGFTLQAGLEGAGGSVIVIAAAAALVLGIVNLVLRPLVLLLSLPFGFFVVFGVGFLVNAIVLWVTSLLLPGFEITNLLAAVLGGLVFGILNTVLTSFLSIDDNNSFYQGVVERLAKRDAFKTEMGAGTGLVMLEIDGLSFHHIQKALDEGWMPTLKRMMEEESYVLTRTDCGLPSQTSACQAGIMFGDNHDIPAFRWFDKTKQHLYVSGKDAAILNQRYAKGQGLMRGGSSINNMMNGDAEKSLFTLANLKTGTKEEQKRRADDVYLLMMNPYFFMRTLALFIGDALKDVWQGWQQKRHDVWPRLNRLHKGYPFVRAATTVFMRDIPAYFVGLDIVRGSPAIYFTWPGYDEVAHHSGPWTTDAFDSLKSFDRTIAHIKQLIETKAPRPYELVILSDHGQSFGPTFLQRYGIDLKSFIESKMPQGTTVAQSAGGDDGVMSVTALSAELDNVQQQGVGGAVGKAVVKQTQKLAERGADEQRAAEEGNVKTANVVAYGSGNMAQVYFDLYPRKIKLGELNAAYPCMVDALVQHEGIGFVAGHAEDGMAMALGKRGWRNLHTGEVQGEDPLLPYADARATVEFRAAQVRRVMDFPNAGDLMVNSTVYPDGSVAALEELIGCHGGVGGEQTDSFLFHPNTWGAVPVTANSADVFHILNARRGLPPAPKLQKEKASEVSSWSPSTLMAGLARVRAWFGLAVQSALLRLPAFDQIGRDPFMTGPALLLGALGVMMASVATRQSFDLGNIAIRFVLWLVSVLVVMGAARVLGGKANYTQTLRVMGFAASVEVVNALAFIPTLAPVVRLLALVWSFVAVWLGTSQVHGLKGWRSLVLPVVAVALTFVAAAAIQLLLAGAQFSIQGVLQQMGGPQ